MLEGAGEAWSSAAAHITPLRPAETEPQRTALLQNKLFAYELHYGWIQESSTPSAFAKDQDHIPQTLCSDPKRYEPGAKQAREKRALL